ncbi:MAG TPA: ATP synthase F1 subunit delta [Myxococcales bacterium]|nr:ATP synthase F1 subunit delta [Myxococcales bacterium]
MVDSSVARRYARALFALGLAEDRFEQYGNELSALLQAMKENRELGFLLGNPGYSQEQRKGAVDAAASALRLSPITVNFLRLLVDRQRIGDLASISRAYGAMVDEQAGRVRATVTSARPLSDDELSRVRDAIARMTGRTIVLESKTDPALIGGLVTQVGATQLDGSVRTQLERMREELKGSSL